MDDWTTNPMNAITVGLGLLVIILFIWIAVVGRRLKKLRIQYKAFMGNTGVTNLEDVIIQMKDKLSEQKEATERLQAQLREVRQTLPMKKGRLGIHRYNAFAEQGGELSFTLAIVDEESDGAVITSIHSRENSYVYAKPVAKGESAYPLTPEERKALKEAK